MLSLIQITELEITVLNVFYHTELLLITELVITILHVFYQTDRKYE